MLSKYPFKLKRQIMNKASTQCEDIVINLRETLFKYKDNREDSSLHEKLTIIEETIINSKLSDFSENQLNKIIISFGELQEGLSEKFNYQFLLINTQLLL